ncbi:MAG: hypothetical protein ACYC46_15605 [Acidobacteriaceae bacterium]
MAKRTPEQILELADKIVRLKKELNSAQSEWDTIFAETPSPTNLISNIPLNTESPQTIDSQILSVLDAHPDQTFSAVDLVTSTGIAFTSVGTQLSKLYRTGKILRHARGTYSSLNFKGDTDSLDSNLEGA